MARNTKRQHREACLRLLLTAVAMCWCTSGRSEPPSFPVAGGFGFNWLEPETAHCVRIGEQDAKQFATCEFHESGGFGLPLAYHVCKGTKGGEYLVFESAAHCREALETMQANAP